MHIKIKQKKSIKMKQYKIEQIDPALYFIYSQI